MSASQSSSSSHDHSSSVKQIKGLGGLPALKIETPKSSAEIYLQGAHVTQFQKRGEAPLLFMSAASKFTEGQPIRGGVPIILPWFGGREGAPAHGFARTRAWNFIESKSLADGAILVHLQLDCAASNGFPPFSAEYFVTVSDTLALELRVTNKSPDQDLIFEECLHTYFTIDNINTTSVVGLKGVTFLDKVDGMKEKVETSDAIKISSEVDRVYMDTASTVEIHDAGLHRKIIVEKRNSVSTVVWNPWIAKAKAMADFGDEEYPKMVCVESGNVGKNKTTLTPGKTSSLKARLSSIAMC